MSKYLTKGTVAGVLSGVASILTAFGLSHYATIVGDPTTAAVATAVVGTIGGLIAGHLPGASKPAA